ncbi:GntR family transcriptional regulator [Nocardia aurantiaca]|uniref:UTRA domain-containing protein n=1 Tax=Nocardia aurantiaca TaxID=2675850 RepID=A0A6I3L6E8_9NOCA|nr:GntR family transcriptional regulator [Nocardia aurantiaca]MTE17467.1 UTRA domain-containing protein [Nocardia aurantiaca]
MHDHRQHRAPGVNVGDRSGRPALHRRVDQFSPGSAHMAARRVRDLLRAEIRRGAFVDGRLPAESELMAQHQASREAVREALDLLRRDGLVERRRGVGTMTVREEYVVPGVLPPQGNLFETYLAGGHITPRLLRWSWMPAPSAVAAQLDAVAVDDDCLCIDYVLLVDDRPMAVFTNYLRSPEASRVDQQRFRTDFYSLLHSSDVAVAGFDLSVQAAAADDCTATLLHIARGEPILLWEQTIRNPDGQAVDYALGAVRGDVVMKFGDIPRIDLTRSLTPRPRR